MSRLDVQPLDETMPFLLGLVHNKSIELLIEAESFTSSNKTDLKKSISGFELSSRVFEHNKRHGSKFRYTFSKSHNLNEKWSENYSLGVSKQINLEPIIRDGFHLSDKKSDLNKKLISDFNTYTTLVVDGVIRELMELGLSIEKSGYIALAFAYEHDHIFKSPEKCDEKAHSIIYNLRKDVLGYANSLFRLNGRAFLYKEKNTEVNYNYDTIVSELSDELDNYQKAEVINTLEFFQKKYFSFYFNFLEHFKTENSELEILIDCNFNKLSDFILDNFCDLGYEKIGGKPFLGYDLILDRRDLLEDNIKKNKIKFYFNMDGNNFNDNDLVNVLKFNHDYSMTLSRKGKGTSIKFSHELNCQPTEYNYGVYSYILNSFFQSIDDLYNNVMGLEDKDGCKVLFKLNNMTYGIGTVDNKFYKTFKKP
ncbi:hypothetical protein HOK68_03105 [Candidatus Woesearchaeota archaeon]|jgi:hypothetical protein|nr:hypothetical protein [Candidatus Woesearchaeota archaeon]MBT4387131.1 hypothetical protein [Candidatus Woesearchaeota archaeon]MBT4596112.1 hypothetical protein [Candidatus Woesearchaeota archaeon]MBT5741666.1 hypothetical protein [Candidatus Woesearchaeota archaeon]MBT6505742.1 hypothetical protein [Candidatus Woesearchaeota archaeon]